MRFYAARANRIIPALAVLCLVLLLFGGLYLAPLDLKDLGKHAASSIGFFSNVIYWQEIGYFAATSREKWLLHTWSLSVEWQFYLIYPLLLVTFRRYLSLTSLKQLVVISTLLSFALCLMVAERWPQFSYYLLPTRVWEMTLGGIAYLYPIKLKDNQKKFLETTGLLLIALSFCFITKDDIWPGPFTLFPVVGAFLLIQAQRNNSFVTGNIVCEKLGQWSYSIYLWHWPIVVAIYSFSLSHFYIYLGIVLSIFLGFLSYRFIEKPALGHHSIHLYRHLRCNPLYLMALTLCIGGYIFINASVSSPSGSEATSEQSTYLSLYHRNNYQKKLVEAYSLHCDFFDVGSFRAKTDGIASRCTDNGKGGIFIWGDSHAQALSYGIRTLFPNVAINQVASSGCRPLIKKDHLTAREVKRACDRSNEKAKKAVLTIQPQVILLAQRIDHDKNDYREIQQYLADHNVNAKIILIGPMPQWQPSLPRVIASRHFDKTKKVIKDPSFVTQVFEINQKMHAKYDQSNINYISLTDHLCQDNACLAKVDDNNTPLVWDYGHLTLEGSVYVARAVINDTLDRYLQVKE